MDKLLAKINRKVKKTETNLKIRITFREEEIDTLFERFSALTFDCADFVLYAPVKSKRYKLHYDFNTGVLTEQKSGTEVDVIELLSSRHLRDLLFEAHEMLYVNCTEDISPLTARVHKKYKSPGFSVDVKYEKRWFWIDSVEVVNDSKIVMDGLISIYNTYAHMPTKAKCEYNTKKKQFVWNYMVGGKKKKDVTEEYYYSNYKMGMQEVLKTYTEMYIEDTLAMNLTTMIGGMVQDMLEILKKQEITLFTKKKTARGVSGFISALFWDIKSVSDDEIVFVVCDGEVKSKDVVFNRIDRKIYAFMPGFGTYKKQEMILIDKDNFVRKFRKVVRMIEKRYEEEKGKTQQ